MWMLQSAIFVAPLHTHIPLFLYLWGPFIDTKHSLASYSNPVDRVANLLVTYAIKLNPNRKCSHNVSSPWKTNQNETTHTHPHTPMYAHTGWDVVGKQKLSICQRVSSYARQHASEHTSCAEHMFWRWKHLNTHTKSSKGKEKALHASGLCSTNKLTWPGTVRVCVWEREIPASPGETNCGELKLTWAHYALLHAVKKSKRTEQ